MPEPRNERPLAIGLSVLAGLLFIVAVPKLLNGLLYLSSTQPGRQSDDVSGILFDGLLIVFGIFCAVRARKLWKRIRAQEEAEWDEDVEQDA